MIVDPLANMKIGVDSYDIDREVYVYSDNSGESWWTKAWFNQKELGEPAVPISKALAIQFIQGAVRKDDWLTRFYPKHMNAIRKSLEQTRMQLLGL